MSEIRDDMLVILGQMMLEEMVIYSRTKNLD